MGGAVTFEVDLPDLGKVFGTGTYQGASKENPNEIIIRVKDHPKLPDGDYSIPSENLEESAEAIIPASDLARLVEKGEGVSIEQMEKEAKQVEDALPELKDEITGDEALKIIRSAIAKDLKAKGRFPLIRTEKDIEDTVSKQYMSLFEQIKKENPEVLKGIFNYQDKDGQWHMNVDIETQEQYWEHLRTYSTDLTTQWTDPEKLSNFIKVSNTLYAQKFLGIKPDGLITFYRNNIRRKNNEFEAAAGYASLDKYMSFDYNVARGLEDGGPYVGRYEVKARPDEVTGLLGFSRIGDEIGVVISPRVTEIPGRFKRVGNLEIPNPDNAPWFDLANLKSGEYKFDRSTGGSPFRHLKPLGQFDYYALDNAPFGEGRDWASFYEANGLKQGDLPSKYDELYGVGSWEKDWGTEKPRADRYKAFFKEFKDKDGKTKWGLEAQWLNELAGGAEKYSNDPQAGDEFDRAIKVLSTMQELIGKPFFVSRGHDQNDPRLAEVIKEVIEPESQEQKPIDFSTFEKVSEKLGSNPGGVYKDPKTGKQYYVKIQDKDRGNNEALGSALYQEAGLDILKVDHGTLNGESVTYTEWREGLTPISKSIGSIDPDSPVMDGFAVDAWLSNWDVVGTGYDNLSFNKDGSPVRLDSGGSLLYRARGARKGEAFGNKVGELDTFRDTSNTTGELYKDISPSAIQRSVEKLKAITPERIDDLVNEYISNSADNAELKEKLKARRQFILDKYADLTPKKESEEPLTDSQANIQSLRKKYLTTDNAQAFHLGDTVSIKNEDGTTTEVKIDDIATAEQFVPSRNFGIRQHPIVQFASLRDESADFATKWYESNKSKYIYINSKAIQGQAKKDAEALGIEGALQDGYVEAVYNSMLEHADAVNMKLHMQMFRDMAAAGITSPPEVKSVLQRDQTVESILPFMSDPSVGISIDTENLFNVLKNGRFKSQFETTTSRGAYNPIRRAIMEQSMMGVPMDMDDKLRPIYGYVTFPTDGESELRGIDPNTFSSTKNIVLSRYGALRVILKPSVKDRTTFTTDDSLKSGYDSAQPLSGKITPEKLYDAGLLNRATASQSYLQNDYFEAQIHNGVSSSDIEKIIVPISIRKRFDLQQDLDVQKQEADKIKQKLKELGLDIPVEIEGETAPESSSAPGPSDGEVTWFDDGESKGSKLIDSAIESGNINYAVLPESTHTSDFTRTSIPKEQDQALFAYSMSMFLDVNEYLRDNNVSILSTKEYLDNHIKNLDALIDEKGDVLEETVIYRGTSAVKGSPNDVLLDSIQEGDIVDDLAYSSATKSPKVAFEAFGPSNQKYEGVRTSTSTSSKRGGNSSFWAITLPVGSKALAKPEGEYAHPHEKEVVLPRGSKFKINSIRKVEQIENGKKNGNFNYFIDATVVPNVLPEKQESEKTGTNDPFGDVEWFEEEQPVSTATVLDNLVKDGIVNLDAVPDSTILSSFTKDDIPLEQANALSYYASARFRSINNLLRYGREAEPDAKIPEIEQKIKDLDALIESKGVVETESFVYRGMIELPKFEDTDITMSEMVDGLKPGDVISDPAFLSTSSDKNVALRKFGPGNMTDFDPTLDASNPVYEPSSFWAIRVPKGGKALPVPESGFGYASTEKEVVLPRNTQLRIDGIKKVAQLEEGGENGNFNYFIEATVVPVSQDTGASAPPRIDVPEKYRWKVESNFGIDDYYNKVVERIHSQLGYYVSSLPFSKEYNMLEGETFTSKNTKITKGKGLVGGNNCWQNVAEAIRQGWDGDVYLGFSSDEGASSVSGHAWLAKDGEILETTQLNRGIYYGKKLTEEEKKQFLADWPASPESSKSSPESKDGEVEFFDDEEQPTPVKIEDLSADEGYSLEFYSRGLDETSRKINTFLQMDRVFDRDALEYDFLDEDSGKDVVKTESELNNIADNINNAIYNHGKLDNPTTLYRGVGENVEGMLENLSVGDTISEPGFSSTALDPKIARRFSDDPGRNGVLFKINAPKGSYGLRLGDDLVPAFSNENGKNGMKGSEVLLPSGTKFKIVSIKKELFEAPRTGKYLYSIEVDVIPQEKKIVKSIGPVMTAKVKTRKTSRLATKEEVDKMLKKADNLSVTELTDSVIEQLLDNRENITIADVKDVLDMIKEDIATNQVFDEGEKTGDDSSDGEVEFFDDSELDPMAQAKKYRSDFETLNQFERDKDFAKSYDEILEIEAKRREWLETNGVTLKGIGNERLKLFTFTPEEVQKAYRYMPEGGIYAAEEMDEKQGKEFNSRMRALANLKRPGSISDETIEGQNKLNRRTDGDSAALIEVKELRHSAPASRFDDITANGIRPKATNKVGGENYTRRRFGVFLANGYTSSEAGERADVFKVKVPESDLRVDAGYAKYGDNLYIERTIKPEELEHIGHYAVEGRSGEALHSGRGAECKDCDLIEKKRQEAEQKAEQKKEKEKQEKYSTPVLIYQLKFSDGGGLAPEHAVHYKSGADEFHRNHSIEDCPETAKNPSVVVRPKGLGDDETVNGVVEAANPTSESKGTEDNKGEVTWFDDEEAVASVAPKSDSNMTSRDGRRTVKPKEVVAFETYGDRQLVNLTYTGTGLSDIFSDEGIPFPDDMHLFELKDSPDPDIPNGIYIIYSDDLDKDAINESGLPTFDPDRNHFIGAKMPIKRSASEQKAIDKYTSSGYKEINDDLIENNGNPSDVNKQIVKDLDSHIDNSALDEDTVLWRGLSVSDPTYKNYLQSLIPGDIVSQPSYMSTSRSRASASSFLETRIGSSSDLAVLMKINAKKGTKGSNAFRSSLGASAHEEEVLLPRGDNMTDSLVVTKVEKDKYDPTLLHMELDYAPTKKEKEEEKASAIKEEIPKAARFSPEEDLLKPYLNTDEKYIFNYGDTIEVPDTDNPGKTKLVTIDSKEAIRTYAEIKYLFDGLDMDNFDEPDESGFTPESSEFSKNWIKDHQSEYVIIDRQKLAAKTYADAMQKGLTQDETADYQKAVDEAASKYANYNNNMTRRRLLKALAEEYPEDELIQRAQRNVEISDRTAEYLANKISQEASIVIAIDPNNLINVLNDGRFKSQFEASRSAGLYDPRRRSVMELSSFGIPSDEDPKKRPIYGYVSFPVNDKPDRSISNNGMAFKIDNESSDQYGKAKVVLKDSAKKKTTFTTRDSLNLSGVPQPMSDATAESVNKAGLADKLSSLAHGLTYSGSIYDTAYMEAQIHGGVSIDDIQEIVLADRFDGDPEIQKQAEALRELIAKLGLGISVKIV
jgi:dsDNA-binding SOS-regulon protein